jgi:hypothetical protein
MNLPHYNLRKHPMNQRPSANRFSKQRRGRRAPARSWHNGADAEIHQYARSLVKAAHTLVENLELNRNGQTAWDACPVILLYREALELHLKALVGEGNGFLPSKTDHISLFSTHSLRWLAQIVCQIVRKIGWEREFTCNGVSSLAEFRAVVDEVESLGPGARVVQAARVTGPDAVTQYYRTFDAAQFAHKMDGLLELLDATADALAAEWDEICELADREKFLASAKLKPVIH